MEQILILVSLVAWLLVCMLHDLRRREVPLKWTLLPLLAAGLYALLNGYLVPVLLTAALIGISDFELRDMRLAFAGVLSAFAGIFAPGCLVQIVALFTVWLLWELGGMGGADAKLLMVVTLVIGQPLVFVLIALAGGVQGILAALTHKQTIPYVVAIFGGTALYTANALVLHIL